MIPPRVVVFGIYWLLVFVVFSLLLWYRVI